MCVCVQMCEHMCVYIYVMCVHVWEDWQGLSSGAEKKEKALLQGQCRGVGWRCWIRLCSPQSSSPGMDERGKEETEEAAGTEEQRERGAGRAETQRSWACSTIPGLRRESRSRQNSHCDPCEEGGWALRSLLRTCWGHRPAAEFCWGEQRGKYMDARGTCHTCAGAGRAPCAYMCRGRTARRIYVFWGRTCTSAYTCAGAGRAHVHLPVQGPDVPARIRCRGRTRPCAYTCAVARHAHVHIRVLGPDVCTCAYMCRSDICSRQWGVC